MLYHADDQHTDSLQKAYDDYLGCLGQLHERKTWRDNTGQQGRRPWTSVRYAGVRSSRSAAPGLPGGFSCGDCRYDNTGNPVQYIEITPQNGLNESIYTYDSLSRLTEEKRASCCPRVFGLDTVYTYDQVGNRLTRAQGGVTTSYVYDNNDKLTSASSGSLSETFAYSLNGNLTSATGSVLGNWSGLTYDDENRFTSVASYPPSAGTESFVSA